MNMLISDIINVKMLMSESLDRPYALGRWRDSEFQHYVTAELPDSGGLLEIDFERRSKTRTEYEVNFYRDGKQHVTGEGNEFRVFATVLAAIQQFIARIEKRTGEKPDALYFDALKPDLEVHWDKRPSRANLYTALIKRHAQRLGYKYRELESRGKVTYYLTRIPTSDVTESEDSAELPSVSQARSTMPRLLQAVQAEYDRWDESDLDTYAGGGICHYIADGICDVLSDAGIECVPVSCDYEQHVYVAAKFSEGVYTIDIPYHIYETGGGFSWQKIPGVRFEPSDVVFYRVSGDPAEFSNYTSESLALENFKDGKGPGRPGDSRRHGIPKKATLSQLDKIGKGSGRKAQLARWQANMRRGRRRSLGEVTIDNDQGWGEVPLNRSVDYHGLRVYMRPSVFLKLAAPLGGPGDSEEAIKQHIASGGAIASPFLDIDIPMEWEDQDYRKHARIAGHEGRNRMRAVLAVDGDEPIEVHLIPRGGIRRRHIQTEWIESMKSGMYAEGTKSLITGPLFKFEE